MHLSGKTGKTALLGIFAAAALGIGGCSSSSWRVDLSRDTVEDKTLAAAQAYTRVTDFRQKLLCTAPYNAPMRCKGFDSLNGEEKAYVETARLKLAEARKNAPVKSAADVRVSPAL